jgi:hypothetical protein
MSSLLNCLNKGTLECFSGKDNIMSIRDKKKPFTVERLNGASIGITYLQFAQVQVEPQLQLAQVQLGLAHFTF